MQKQDSKLMFFKKIYLEFKNHFCHSELKLHVEQLIMCAIAWRHAEKLNQIKKHTLIMLLGICKVFCFLSLFRELCCVPNEMVLNFF